jgi:integrase
VKTVDIRTVRIGVNSRHTALPPGKTELLLRDKDLTGFSLRIRKSSARYVMTGRIAGTSLRRTITIGDANSLTATQAREAAMGIRNAFRRGDDPAAEAAPPEPVPDIPTFADVAADYLRLWAAGKTGREKAPRPASIASMGFDLKRPMSALGAMKVTAINALAVRKFRAKLLAEDVSPATKRRAFGAMTVVLNHAQDVGHIATSPADGFALPAASPPRERFLSAEELKTVWDACPALGRQGDAVRFLICMPVRLSIARLMRWDWIDIEAKNLTVPATAVGNKAGEVFVLPLPDLAVDILMRQPTRTGLVFRGRAGGPVSLGSTAKVRLDALSGITGWQIHDLRRTVVSLLADADPDIDTDACDRWLLHKRSGVRAVYQRANRLSALRKVAASWDRVLRGILGLEQTASIVPFPGAIARASS